MNLAKLRERLQDLRNQRQGELNSISLKYTTFDIILGSHLIPISYHQEFLLEGSAESALYHPQFWTISFHILPVYYHR